jgi:histidine kinase
MKTKWYHQLHWKLFVSHLVIITVAVVALLSTANVIASVVLDQGVPFYPGVTMEESAGWQPEPMVKEMMLERFQIAVQEAIIVSAVVALATAVLMSLFISRRIVEPLQAISAMSQRLAQGFYRERTMINAEGELSELNRNINHLADALEQTEQRRRALLADVTHELRTPLSTIEGYMEGLIDGMVKPDAQTYTLILRESIRMQRLIEDLELLSRAEAGQIRITARSLDLRRVLDSIIARLKPQFDEKGIILSSRLNDIILAVWADPDRIEQVVINLLTNALRYTSEGGRVEVHAWVEDERIVTAIRDTGIGIAPEHLPHLFERFYRVDKSRSRASGGSGIGLTISRHLMYAHGGDLYAESPGSGRGSTFYITLPRASAFAVSPPSQLDIPPGSLPHVAAPVGQAGDSEQKITRDNQG